MRGSELSLAAILSGSDRKINQQRLKIKTIIKTRKINCLAHTTFQINSSKEEKMKQPSISSVFTQAKHYSQPAHAGASSEYIAVSVDKTSVAKGPGAAKGKMSAESMSKIVVVERASPKDHLKQSKAQHQI